MDKLKIADREFNSRLMIGTGKFQSSKIMLQAAVASGAEIITVALRRVDLKDTADDILSHIDRNKFLLLPNTSGAINAEEAIRLARLAKASLDETFLKLEVTPDPINLLPDPIETLKAAEVLVKEGFKVLPYINADPILAKRLEEIGCVTVMPLAAPIGTNRGLTTKEMIKIIIENSNVPVVVDAGIGLPSHAADAIEMGADAVLVNTAIAIADNPVLMAEAFKHAVASAELTRDAGPGSTSHNARNSSPLTGISKSSNKKFISDLLKDIK